MMIVGQTVYHSTYGFGIVLDYNLGDEEIRDTVRVQWDNGHIGCVNALTLRRIHRQTSKES